MEKQDKAETVLVPLPVDLYKRICKLGQARKTQSNRATASPLYFSIEQDHYVPAPDGCGDRTVIYDSEFTEAILVEDLPLYLKDNYPEEPWPDNLEQLINGMDSFELVEFVEKQLPEEHTVHEERNEPTRCNAFITAEGCDKHIRDNSYHYTNGRSYAEHAYRNPEMQAVLDLIDAVTEADTQRAKEESVGSIIKSMAQADKKQKRVLAEMDQYGRSMASKHQKKRK